MPAIGMQSVLTHLGVTNVVARWDTIKALGKNVLKVWNKDGRYSTDSTVLCMGFFHLFSSVVSFCVTLCAR